MKTLFPAIATLLLAGGIAPHVQAQPQAPACALTVEFGSYAMGIDQRAYAAIDRFLARDRRVTSIDRRRWGREGEVTLCVGARSEAGARQVARALKRLLPAKPRGPIGVSTAGGLEIRAPAQ